MRFLLVNSRVIYLLSRTSLKGLSKWGKEDSYGLENTRTTPCIWIKDLLFSSQEKQEVRETHYILQPTLICSWS